jgi:hypothetical protein
MVVERRTGAYAEAIVGRGLRNAAGGSDVHAVSVGW